PSQLRLLLLLLGRRGGLLLRLGLRAALALLPAHRRHLAPPLAWTGTHSASPQRTPASRIADSSRRSSCTSSRSRAAYSNRRSFAASCISSSSWRISRSSSSRGMSGTSVRRRREREGVAA